MTDLADRLQALAHRLDLPASVDVTAIVGVRQAVPPRRPTVHWRWALVPLAVVIGIFAIPGARHSVARWLGLYSTRIEVPTPGSPTPGSPTTVSATFPTSIAQQPETDLASAELEVGLPAPVPSLLGPPQHVAVTHPPDAGQITLTYDPNTLLPESPIPGIGAIVSAFKANLEGGFFQKAVQPGTTLELVQVGEVTGFWLAGTPHSYAYVSGDGGFEPDTLRLATNTLIWEVDGVTYRIEADVEKDTALRIAATIDTG